MKAYPGQSGTGLVLYDAWAVPGVITDMCCLLKFTDHYPQPPDLLGPTRYVCSVRVCITVLERILGVAVTASAFIFCSL